jgi:hypothetical protein
LPGRTDSCAVDLGATRVEPDGSTHVEPLVRRPGADAVDCFYVYPTVDMSLAAGNHTDFSNLDAIRSTTLAQAARFRAVCNLYVPLYRQTTIGSYVLGTDVRRPYREVALSDVVDAFLHYMGTYNRGHKIVLLGHSQGAEMVIALLQRFFDDDARAREALLLAMPIGSPMEVEPGRTTGGTFSHLPVCTRAGETACVVGYRSYDGEHEVKPPGRDLPTAGRESVCVNPAELAHGTERLAQAVFPTERASEKQLHALGDPKTPYVIFGGFFGARCISGESGFRYLGVFSTPPAGDRRASPVDLSSGWMHTEMGLHLYDMQFTQGDLIDLVAQRAERLGPG